MQLEHIRYLFFPPPLYITHQSILDLSIQGKNYAGPGTFLISIELKLKVNHILTFIYNPLQSGK